MTQKEELKMKILERSCLVYSDVLISLDDKLGSIRNVIEDNRCTHRQKLLLIKNILDDSKEVE